ncbi:thioredoxin family protein [Alkalicoccus saliphilus]|uniref:Thiol reductase thioredoxin n=1 Tax=Alkalicoccus saliphilus TaxID=200989 RepID=A0A2T4U786_9BACI|nr:thioredoxin family protein [Alkalicoccus saliphilus]PTL39268.1 thiol reductase thioredoxin [Alkalicoccus saliphilus]
MKKIIIFGGVIILLFAALIFVTQQQNQQQAADNPFGKDTLAQETIDQLDDPLYENIILPEELDERLENGGDALVYFYSGQCEYCNQATPLAVPAAEEEGVELELYNILEFPDGWEDYDIEGTPTFIYFEDGTEVDRISGLHGQDTYEDFFAQASE